MSNLIFLRNDKRLLLGSVSGSVDTDFNANWLIDERNGFPVKKTGGAIDLTATPPASVSCDFFTIFSHTIDPAVNVTLTRNGGTAVGVLTPGAWGEDGVPYNPYLLLSAPVSVTSLRLVVTGNSTPVVIGELYAGLSTDLGADFLFGISANPGQPVTWESELAPVDDGLSEERTEQGQLILTDAQFSVFSAWYRSTRKGIIPTVVLPDSNVNDAWLATIECQDEQTENLHFVSLTLREKQRRRW